MEKFTELERIVVMNALKDYQKSVAGSDIQSACDSARNKLMPILLGISKEEMEIRSKKTLDQITDSFK